MKLNLRRCEPKDLSILRDFSYNTFNDTFSHMNTQSTMNAYLEHAFNIDRLRGELSDKHSSFYFLYVDSDLAGYLKLNETEAQTDIYDPQSLEIERIYVAKEFQGRGLGGVLIEKAANEADKLGKTYMWLGVWEKNSKAMQFYEKHGFYKTGTHSFYMGDEEQTDFILRKDLKPVY